MVDPALALREDPHFNDVPISIGMPGTKTTFPGKSTPNWLCWADHTAPSLLSVLFQDPEHALGGFAEIGLARVGHKFQSDNAENNRQDRRHK
jgi:hypothetical protein